MAADPDPRASARAWHIRQSDPAATASDWMAFTDWLDRDPAHRIAYDAVAERQFGLERLPSARRPVETPAHVSAKRARIWRRIALALAIAAPATWAVLDWPTRLAPTYALVATAPGERRTVKLDDGSRIEMNGATRIALSDRKPRFARLDQGEATFFVQHRNRDPFVVETGPVRLVDQGTVFNVVREPSGLDVQVSEGAVMFNPETTRILLEAGRTLRLDEAGKRVVLGRSDPATIGGWRTGRLVYSDASLSSIAEDLSRSLDKRVEADAGLASRRFTGVILVDGEAVRLRRQIGALLDVNVRDTAEGWLLTPR